MVAFKSSVFRRGEGSAAPSIPRLLAAARSGQRQLTHHADAAATAALTFISTWHKPQDSKEDDPWEPSSDNAAPGFMCLAPNSVSHARPLTSFAPAWPPSKLIALFVCNQSGACWRDQLAPVPAPGFTMTYGTASPHPSSARVPSGGRRRRASAFSLLTLIYFSIAGMANCHRRLSRALASVSNGPSVHSFTMPDSVVVAST